LLRFIASVIVYERHFNVTRVDRELAISLYRSMLGIRLFEEKVLFLYQANKLYGMSPHLYIGEEAIAAGVCALLRPDDYIVSTHRGHGHCLAKGASMKKMLAELCGRSTGYCKGRGGSMHIADTATGNLGANGIVGAGLPIACGAGLSIRYRKTDQVVACFFGDAATNQGTFHEAVNFSAVMKLPVIWICENNLYGLSTPIRKMTCTKTISERASAYGIPGVTVDGMDVLAVYGAAEGAVNRARSGEGPTLIEAVTYRFLGHGLSDNRSYRTKEEEAEWRKRCPIQRMRTYLLEESLANAEELERIRDVLKAEVDEAENFALTSPEPEQAEATKYVFTD